MFAPRATISLTLLAALVACGPIGPLPGGRLSGEVVLDRVEDWSFSDAHPLIQLESRPWFPHSVTTICFTHEGRLYVPAANPRGKAWPSYVLDDPRVRVKIGDKIYRGRAQRVSDESVTDAMFDAARQKYEQMAASRDELPEIWLFRIDSAR